MIAARAFERSFLLPQIAVLAMTLLSLFGLFWGSVSQQNEMSRSKEIMQIESGLAGQVEFVRKNIRDYAIWTDAAQNLAVDFNAEWANANIGPYLFDVQGYDYSFVVGVDGKTVYASVNGKQSQTAARQVLGAEVDRLLGELNKAPEGKELRLGRLASIGKAPAIVAASPIMPTIGDATPPGLQRRYLIFAKLIDNAVLAELAVGYRTKALQLQKGAPDTPGMAMLGLRDAANQPIGWLHWQAERPGDVTRDKYLPWLLLVAAAAILIATNMLRNARIATRDLAASEASARHLASHDMLTGLPNRRAMRARGMRALGQRKAVLYLDLDGFKEVNDLFGHQAGDALLREAALRLRVAVGDHGMLARVGGDEFSILLTGDTAHDDAAVIAQTIVQSLSEPFVANHINMVVSASVGVALGEPSDNVDDLSRYADVAMYAAKDRGKCRWLIYSPEMDEGRAVRKILESELRDAIRNKDIEVVFQPIVDARTSDVTCVEALARWTSPTQGPIGPAIFVPIAEESGLIVELGELVLRKACMAARDWPVSLAVNLSPAQFWNTSLAEDVMRILDECGFPASRLELEITEGYLLSRPDTAAEIIGALRSQGIRLALDDFGTGFASIGYLRRFSLDRIKLDRSFVDTVEQDEEAMMVAQAVITLSQALKLPITAEGVENVLQSKMLTIAGCERLQGWYYGRPAEPGTLTEIFAVEADKIAPKPAKMRDRRTA